MMERIDKCAELERKGLLHQKGKSVTFLAAKSNMPAAHIQP